MSIVALVALVTGCSDNTPPDFYNGTGTIDVSIDVVEPEDAIPDDLMPQPGDFAVTISDGANEHTWKTLGEFTQGSRYLVGQYHLKVEKGSFFESDNWFEPVFSGETDIIISEGERTSVTVSASLASAMFTVERTQAFTDKFGRCNLTAHPSGGGYFVFDGAEPSPRTIFTAPTGVSLSMVARGDKGSVNLPLSRMISTIRGRLTSVTVDFDPSSSDVIVKATTAGKTVTSTFRFLPEMLEGLGPAVSVSESSLSLCEHTLPPSPLIFNVSHERPLSSLILTIDSRSLIAQGAPHECDLLNLTADQRRFMTDAGVTIPVATDGDLSLDLSPLLSMLRYNDGQINKSLIGVVAVDELSRLSDPATVNVSTLPVEMEVEHVSPAMIGVDLTDITIISPAGDPTRFVTLVCDGHKLEIISAESLGDGRYRLRFRVPSGNVPVTLSIYYDGKIKGEYTVGRIAPGFSLEVDPFASIAVVRVKADDESLLPIIIDNLHMLVNGQMSELYQRNHETSTLVIMNLEPHKAYRLRASLLENIADDPDAVEMTFITESATDLPNPGFEDVKNTLKYKDMPQGGPYSQTIAEIFNSQNHTSFDLWTPTGWANTNAKTFNSSSSNPNTWYMHPSVFSTTESAGGDYAVELVSVAFDPAGPVIRPYVQESTPYVPYSRNIPPIAYRAAGRLFLGSYEFNPVTVTERYVEGIPFTSRPLSLSGFYRYTPSRANVHDAGEVSIEVLGLVNGAEHIIASNRTRLAAVTGNGYAAFNISLAYKYFGVKATRLRIMFTSSISEASISTETSTVRTWNDPKTSTSVGSRLLLDNITLAY